MKNFEKLILVSFFLAAQTVMAQNVYYVLNVKGNVKLEKTKTSLKINDQISDKDAVLFGAATDAVVVISSKSGRMILRPKPAAKPSELMCVVSDILKPGTGRLSARGDGSITNFVELKNHFGVDSLNILGTAKFWISPTEYPMNSTSYFFIRYTWKERTIDTRLMADADSLLLSEREIYKVDGRAILPKDVKNAKLLYKQGVSVSEIGPFTVSFPSEKSAIEIILSFKIHSSLKGEQFLDELTPLLRDIYGRTDKDNLRSWVRKSIGPY